ncbi:MAG: hypothetical protein LBP67_05180 [Bacteroidales bacterium]|jgi:hypothetical protein|nr:hypothetical protein [Bacteroidales bacterium]
MNISGSWTAYNYDMSLPSECRLGAEDMPTRKVECEECGGKGYWTPEETNEPDNEPCECCNGKGFILEEYDPEEEYDPMDYYDR